MIEKKKQILNKLEKLRKEWDAGSIPREHEHEVNPRLPKGSRENYLYFIMTCSLNFQRNSPNTWKSALETWKDLETNFVFFPEEVVKSSTEDLRIALLKHRLALQPNKHIDIWKRISETWSTHFDNDPRKLITRNDNDVLKILQVVQVEMKKGFPYLSGPKLSNYFLFILLHYSDIKLQNKSELSIIPDTHILQSTVKLGILSKCDANPLAVETAWRELLLETKYSPIDFHSLLWNWSRGGFLPVV